MTVKSIVVFVGGCLVMGTWLGAQTGRPLSPDGVASAQVLGKWVKSERQSAAMGGERYQEGKWIDIAYGRPLLRGREAFGGTGSEYGKTTHPGAPVWRAGANVSTRLKTEVALVIGGTTVPPGEYSLFIELKQPTEWTLIVSTWGALKDFGPSTKDALYGAFDYTPARDVARASMKVDSLPFQVEQLSWDCLDMTVDSGRMAVMWDKSMGSAPFKVGR
jgi:hypothetical protein